MPEVRELLRWLYANYKPDDVIAYALWNDTDVELRAADMILKLTEKQRAKVLEKMHRDHDPEYGISYQTLDTCIREIVDQPE